MNGSDTVALLPTGGGKSVCYQVPATASKGCCIVVSPLISLMTDQVDDLNQRGIKSIAISSFMKYRDIDRALDNAIYGNYKLLYISPERIQTEIFQKRFEKMNVSFVAVDEAHCISQWGYDFRPAYLEINTLREIKDVPILALTATATERVLSDIVSNLELRKPNHFKKSFKRENIAFSVLECGNKNGELLRLTGQSEGSGIVYTRNRRRCKELAESMQTTGRSTSFYHAGLDKDTRYTRQTEWAKQNDRVMVATNAFGMGIDKPDVRFVIHYELPDSLESFYQEAGRAGRDGLDSIAVLLFSPGDVKKIWKDFEQSYPTDQQVRSVFQKLCNHLQLAVGSGKELEFNFDLNDFCKKQGIAKRTGFEALKILETEGIIALSEAFHQPSTLMIISIIDDLKMFQKGNPEYNPLIEYLLRAFSRILEQDVAIRENDIGRHLSMTSEEVTRKLSYLSSLNLLEYKKQTDLPRIVFLKDRPSAAQLIISPENLKFKRKRQEARISAMVDYVQLQKGCRMQAILTYFGEEQGEPCGKCDLCLKTSGKRQDIVGKLEHAIRRHYSEKGEITMKDIESVFPGQSSKKLSEFVRELCENEVLAIKGPNRFVLN